MRTEQARPVRLTGLPPARLAGRNGRARRLAASHRDARARDAARSSPIRRRSARAARARRRRAQPQIRVARRRAAAARALRRRPPTASPSRSRRTGRSACAIETMVDPSANTQLMGLYRSGQHLLHAMRGGRLSPHHLFPRPAGRDGGLHHPHRGGQSRSAGAARERQPDRASGDLPGTGRHFAVWHDPFPKPCYLFAHGRRQRSAASRTASSPCPAARWRCASMSSPARRRAAATPWTRSSAPCAGTRRRSAANTTSTSS